MMNMSIPSVETSSSDASLSTERHHHYRKEGAHGMEQLSSSTTLPARQKIQISSAPTVISHDRDSRGCDDDDVPLSIRMEQLKSASSKPAKAREHHPQSKGSTSRESMNDKVSSPGSGDRMTSSSQPARVTKTSKNVSKPSRRKEVDSSSSYQLERKKGSIGVPSLYGKELKTEPSLEISLSSSSLKKKMNALSTNSSLPRKGGDTHETKDGRKRKQEKDQEAYDDDDMPLSLRVKKEFNKEIKLVKQQSREDVSKVAVDDKRTENSGIRIKKIKREPSQVKAEPSPTKTPLKVERHDSTGLFKWWEQTDFDDSVKWTNLEHHGVYFPPDYVPHHVKMLYGGQEIELEPEIEEIAGFYAQLLDTEWVENPIFRKNFFQDFLKALNKNRDETTTTGPHPIRELDKCDFTPMQRYYLDLKEKRKLMGKEEKEILKAEKASIEAKYGWALVDERREKVGNFRVEPPGLFRGRGQHPKAGCLKLRVQPEQVIINLGKMARIPDPPPGHSWGGVVHDNTVAWLATWTENVQNSQKYVLFAASSTIKGQSDMKKFEKARELKKHIHRIRRDYMRDLRDEKMEIRQRATALYLIDRLALRAGNEKGEDEADTVGCCSLRVEHLKLEAPNKLVLDFLGKDSIRYYNEVFVDEQVFKNLGRFQKGIEKKPGDPLFDRLNTGMLNRHLNSLMSGLTAKVFRTHNASFVFQEELEKTPRDATIHERLLAYNRANRQVAVLCNHQRSVPKAHGQQMLRLKDKIIGLKIERRDLRLAILAEDSKRGARNPALLDEESDLDEETIGERKKQASAEQEEKKLRDMDSQESLNDEKGSSSPSKKKLSIERMEEKILKLDERIIALKTMMIDKDENKTTALGTSKINYLDPRISMAWCFGNDVPIEKIFNKSLRDKFQWAMNVDSAWKF